MIDGFDITSIESIREQVVAWLGTCRYFGKIETVVGAHGKATYHGERLRMVVSTAGEEGVKSDRPFEPSLKLVIWTDRHSYGIVAHPARPPVAGPLLGKGYLGCVMSLRAPRPGEDWTRGSDLHDGPFTDACWMAILTDILGNEAQAVHIPRTPSRVAVGELPAPQAPTPLLAVSQDTTPTPRADQGRRDARLSRDSNAGSLGRRSARPSPAR